MSMVDYVLNNMWQLWAVVAVICLIVELFTVGFFVFCFAVGAIFALLASFVFDVYVQLAVFVVISAVCIFLVRPFALRFLQGTKGECRTNADALIGRKGVVTQTIEAGGYGRVSAGGDDWKAEADNGERLEEGTRVIVTGRESIIIKVTKSL